MATVTSVTPQDEQRGEIIARSGYTVVLDCGHTANLAPHFAPPKIGSTYPCRHSEHPTPAERTAITRNALADAQRRRASWRTEPDTFDTLRDDPYTTGRIDHLQASFDNYGAGPSAAERIDDMIARGLLTYQEEAETLLELNAPHLFHAVVTSGPAPVEPTGPVALAPLCPVCGQEEPDHDPACDRAEEIPAEIIAATEEAARLDALDDLDHVDNPNTHTMAAPVLPPSSIAGECEHRGGEICNAIGEHSFAHDGYADNADAYRAGWNIARDTGQPISDRAAAYYTTAGPDRVAFQAGWIARQRFDSAKRAAVRASYVAEINAQEARNRAYLADHATNQINDATNTLAALADHDEPCAYTLKASTGLVLDHLLTLIEAPATTPEGEQERQRCKYGHDLPARTVRGAWLPLRDAGPESAAYIGTDTYGHPLTEPPTCSDCGKQYAAPAYYTTEDDNLCPSCAGPFLDPDNDNDPRRPAQQDDPYAAARTDAAWHTINAQRAQIDPAGALAELDARYHDQLPAGTNCRACGIEHAAINGNAR